MTSCEYLSLFLRGILAGAVLVIVSWAIGGIT